MPTNGQTQGHVSPSVGRSLRFDGSISLGSIIQIVTLIVAVTLAYSEFDKRTAILEYQFSSTTKQLEEIHDRTERIENYLISKDPNYLQETRKNK
jgi:hypothetical protein